MPKKVLPLFLLSCSLLTEDAMAAAIGMPEAHGRWGYGLGVAHVNVHDPDVSTGSEWAVRPLNLIYTNHWRYGTRYWSELFYQETAFDASVSQAGQQAKQLGARLSLQKNVALTPTIFPWFGVGLQLSHDRFRNRHTVDSGGYLNTTYPDRSKFNAALLVNMLFEKHLDLDWTVATKLEQSLALGSGVSEFSVSAVLLYRY